MSLRRPRPAPLAYGMFVLIGLNLGAGGVLLPAQIVDYGVDKATIGITFFAFAIGFTVAGGSVGPLVERLGARPAVALGAGEYVLGGLVLATRPPFWAFVAIQVLLGHGIGLVESELNAWLSELPAPAVRLNRLHAFFGVGALLGPLLATWLLGARVAGSSLRWTAVVLVLALLAAPLIAGFLLTEPPPGEAGADRPGPATDPARRTVPGDPTDKTGATGATGTAIPADPAPAGSPIPAGQLRTVLRSPPVVLAAVFLALYVGLEVSVGNWAFSYLVGDREAGETAAGWLVSGFWMGLTLGRFVIAPLAARAGRSATTLTSALLTGVLGTAVLIWLTPITAVAGGGLALLGFFLGPLFPTAMAVVPDLTTSRLVPAAIGVMNAVSTWGGAIFPWLAGALAQALGGWTLLPFVIVLALLQLLCWRRIRPPA
jgi:fucose permease